MSTPYLSQIKIFSFNFAPRYWAQCNGQLMPIQQNQALFSLLGTTYGGNGVQTYGLPDLRSRTLTHFGSGYTQGETDGQEMVTLMSTELPSHSHTLSGLNVAGNRLQPDGYSLANIKNTYPHYATIASTTPLNPASVQPAGGGGAHENIQPYLAVNFCIALMGVFPSRN